MRPELLKPGGCLKACRPNPVILSPLLGVAKDCIGLIDLLKPYLRPFVPRIQVRMAFTRKTSERLFYLVLRSVLAYFQHRIIVFHTSRHPFLPN